jgi:DNA-directed RNA polymerase specialized sigma24 family protein
VMREVEGLSADEIGCTMGWNEQKVRNELFKARQVLRQWLRAQGQEDGQ